MNIISSLSRGMKVKAIQSMVGLSSEQWKALSSLYSKGRNSAIVEQFLSSDTLPDLESLVDLDFSNVSSLAEKLPAKDSMAGRMLGDERSRATIASFIAGQFGKLEPKEQSAAAQVLQFAEQTGFFSDTKDHEDPEDFISRAILPWVHSKMADSTDDSAHINGDVDDPIVQQCPHCQQFFI